MNLERPAAPSNDARYETEQKVYLNHCQNIATIISAVADKKWQNAIDLYLVATNAPQEPAP